MLTYTPGHSCLLCHLIYHEWNGANDGKTLLDTGTVHHGTGAFAQGLLPFCVAIQLRYLAAHAWMLARSPMGQEEGGDCDTVNDNMASAVRLECISSQNAFLAELDCSDIRAAIKQRDSVLQQYSIPLGSGLQIPCWPGLPGTFSTYIQQLCNYVMHAYRSSFRDWQASWQIAAAPGQSY